MQTCTGIQLMKLYIESANSTERCSLLLFPLEAQEISSCERYFGATVADTTSEDGDILTMESKLQVIHQHMLKPGDANSPIRCNLTFRIIFWHAPKRRASNRHNAAVGSDSRNGSCSVSPALLTNGFKFVGGEHRGSNMN